MSGISIINTINRMTPDLRPRGHYVGTINSYSALFSPEIPVQLVSPPAFRAYFETQAFEAIPDLSDTYATHSRFPKLRRLWHLALSIRQVLLGMKKSKFKAVFFPSPDTAFFIIFPYLKLRYPFTRFMFNTYSYQPKYHPRWGMRMVMKFAYRMCAVVFISDPTPYQPNLVYLPDYMYEPRRYSRFLGASKQNRVLIIGGLSLQEKEIVEAIHALGKAQIPVLIAGPISNQNDRKLIESASSQYKSVELKSGYFPDDHYDQLIAESKFVLLPYRKNRYLHRSSGVVLEATYLNTAVIAPDFLLSHSDIPGIGYSELSEIPNLILKSESAFNFAEIQNRNLFSVVQNRILPIIKSVIE